MSAAWEEGGDARAAVLADDNAGLAMMLTGMGSLSYGEMAGQRMKLGVLLNDPEEEHDCFSDNTQFSHFYDGLGIQNVYLGAYIRSDGTVVSGPSLDDLLIGTDPAIATQLRDEIAATMTALGDIVAATENGMAYDMMLARDNAAGEALILGAVEALVVQTRSIERAVTALGLGALAVEGSDSLDAPDAVFQ